MGKLCVSLLLCAMLALGKANDNITLAVAEKSLSGHVEAVSSSNAHGQCPALWTLIDGRCFHFNAQPSTWAQAQQNCQLMGGNLASITSAEEYNKVQQLTGATKPQTWIGGSDCQESGAWFWIDGTPMPYNYWCPAQPDNTREECCMQMNTGPGLCWDDQNCSNFLSSVCVKAL